MCVCVCVCVCVCSLVLFVNSGPAKMEEAADLYVKAANAYKIAKKHTGPFFPTPKTCRKSYTLSSVTLAAGNAFRKAAEIHFKLDTKHEGAAILADAGQVLKKDSPKGRTVVFIMHGFRSGYRTGR